MDALRDHGEVLFIHLRDRSGIIQVVIGPETADRSVCEKAGQLKNEYCVSVSGLVMQRAEGTGKPLCYRQHRGGRLRALHCKPF
ncbi:MAG: OB-fold nucleic acid binding domain-containing protein [Desulfobacterales bacterium]